MIRYCEYCKKEIDENNVYGKGRFCNKRCQILSIKDKGRQAFIENAKNRKQERTVKKICPCCGKEFETVIGRKDELKFCSRHCSATYSGNKSRDISDEQKKIMSAKMKAFYEAHPEKKAISSINAQKLNNRRHNLKNEIKPYTVKPERLCSVCHTKIKFNNKTGLCQHCLRTTEQGKAIIAKTAKIAADKLIASGKHQGWKTRNISSYAEKFWTKVLDNNGVSYKRELTVKYSNGPNEHYFLDFYIESNGRKIDLEIDGKQHKYVDRAEHDRVRDERLTNLGYVVYRIDWNEINSEKGKLRMKEKIDKFLDFLNK
jgi:very-short-patch-repair endonuclease